MGTLFTVTFIVELIFGIGFIIGPGFLLGTFGVPSTPDLVFMARLFGSALLMFSTLLWYTRGSKSTDLQKAAIRSFFLYYLLSTIFIILGQLTGLFNIMGWSMVVMHTGFLIWYSVYAFKN